MLIVRFFLRVECCSSSRAHDLRHDYRDVANGLLCRAGIEVRRKPPTLIRSTNEVTFTLEHACAHLAAFDPGDRTVVQVGAFDGRLNDPIVNATAIRMAWVLVEPQPGPFASLSKVHDGDKTVQAFNVAIAEKDGRRPMYTLKGNDLPWWAPQAATFDPEPFRNTAQIHGRGRRHTGDRGGDVDISDTLSGRAGIDHVDVLQVDAKALTTNC